ncbi:hypothetical protein POTOM_042508 [Populus tomentosa]|uniref:Uncharacterized protein n=1 Tax=Populus tomentosa TaxID=118781 RepID=A0A8X7YNR5_POPTO|nr:hypothetical protein POTOM_042508 [Populus tomentosa]
MDSPTHHHHYHHHRTIEKIDKEQSITTANLSSQPELKDETLTDPEESQEFEEHNSNKRINNARTTAEADIDADGLMPNKKRRRPCNSDFVDLTEAARQNSVSSGLAPVASTSPQGLVPIWPMGTLLFPQGSAVGGGESNQARFWAFPLPPGLQSAGNVGVGFGGGESMGSGGSPSNNIGSMSSSSSGSSTTSASTGGGGSQMLRDLQYLGHPVNHDHQQAPCSESCILR